MVRIYAAVAIAVVFIAILLVYQCPEAIKGLVEIIKDLPMETPVHYKRMISSKPIVNWY